MFWVFLGCFVIYVFRAFLGCFVIDVFRAFLSCFVIDVFRAFLGCFVIDIAIILLNRRGLVTFSWRNLSCLVKSNTFLLYFMCIFCLLIFLMHIFFALPSPFLEQPSIQRCASRCKPCDHLESASFETNDPRRLWRTIVLSETHKDARMSVSLSCLVRGPRRSYGCT